MGKALGSLAMVVALSLGAGATVAAMSGFEFPEPTVADAQAYQAKEMATDANVSTTVGAEVPEERAATPFDRDKREAAQALDSKDAHLSIQGNWTLGGPTHAFAGSDF